MGCPNPGCRRSRRSCPPRRKPAQTRRWVCPRRPAWRSRRRCRCSRGSGRLPARAPCGARRRRARQARRRPGSPHRPGCGHPLMFEQSTVSSTPPHRCTVVPDAAINHADACGSDETGASWACTDPTVLLRRHRVRSACSEYALSLRTATGTKGLVGGVPERQLARRCPRSADVARVRRRGQTEEGTRPGRRASGSAPGEATDRHGAGYKVLTPACGVFTPLSQRAVPPWRFRCHRRGPGPAVGRRGVEPSPPSRWATLLLEARSGLTEQLGQDTDPSPHSSARRVRSHEASAGLSPPVDTETVTAPSRCTAGRMNEEWAMSSALLAQTPAASASA